MLARITAAHSKPHRSFLGNVEHGAKLAIDPVAWTFDKLERPAYAVANAADKGLQYHHVDLGAALHGAREGFMGREKTNFGAIMAHRGILNNHKYLRGALGLAADVATDPLSYTGAGVARKAATEALDSASKVVLQEGTGYTAKESERAARIAKLSDAHKTLSAGGEQFQHRAALAKLGVELNSKVASGQALTEVDRAGMNVARNTAKAEMKAFDKKYLKIRIGPNSRGGMRTPVPLVSKKVGEMGIPGLSKVASSLGKAFKPGYEDPILHAQLLGRRHQGERLAKDYFGFIRHRFKGLEKLKPEDQRAVLHFFEKPKGGAKAVIRKGDHYVLNPKHIERARKAGFSEAQLEFVQAMHDTAEHFAGKHAEYGLDIAHLGAQGKLYVPHIVQKTGEGLTDAQRNLLSKRGFVKNRAHDLSVAELHALHEGGRLPHDIETNPFNLLTIHARSVANQHADQLMVNYMRDAVGVPTRLVDKEALAKAQMTRASLEHQIAAHPAFDEVAHTKAIKDLKVAHEARVHHEYSETLARNNAAIKDHLENREWKQTTLATVKRISQRSVAAQAKLSEDVKAIREERNPGLLKDLNPLKASKVEQGKNLSTLEKRLSTAMRAEKDVMKGSKNPAVNSETMRTIENKTLRDEHGHKYAFPHQVADSLERLHKVMDGDEATLNAFSNGYRKWLGKWKVAVTTVNPSYGVRNTLSDYWNMYLSGVPLHAMPVYGAKAAHLMSLAAKGDKLAVSKMLDAYDSGILSGLFSGDIKQVANYLEQGSTVKTLAQKGRFIKAASKMSQEINAHRENWGRLTHYLYRLDQGKSVSDAADLVKEAHFDYEDLTPFEQKRMKVIAPFYTWSRKNIPFQIKALVEHPGQMAAFPQFGSEAAQASGAKPGDIVPPYMEQNMALKFGGKYFNPMIGITDLQNAVHPMQLASNLLSPAIKTPLELMANKNLLTGLPIKDPTSYARNPVNDKLAGLLKLIPGSNVGETGRKNAAGKEVHGLGADPILTYLLGQTPLTNNIFNKGGKIHNAQHPADTNKALLSELTGINGTTVDQNQQKEFESIAFQDQMKALMKNLRAEGLIPATTAHNSAQQKMIQEILFRALRGG
jgi:hypothetical protein